MVYFPKNMFNKKGYWGRDTLMKIRLFFETFPKYKNL